MKKYIKPAISFYEVAPASILAGSGQNPHNRSNKVGVSSFFTDDQDWSGGEQNSGSYSFWD